MGERHNESFQLSFNASLKVDFQGSRVTSDGGLILIRELDERLGLYDLIAKHLSDARRGKNTQLPLADLFRQSVYSRMAGHVDINDAERLSQDPAFRLIGSERVWDRGIALTSGCRRSKPKCWPRRRISLRSADQPRTHRQGRSTGFAAAGGAGYGQHRDPSLWPAGEERLQRPRRIDLLSSFNREGDCLAAKLRPGNVHSSEDWEELLLPEIERQ
jgi:hypothetical protein